MPFSDITFQPKYFPTSVMSAWLALVINKKPNAMSKIVVVNEAYTIDYNNYFDLGLEKELNKLIEQNPLPEDLAIEYVLPNFKLLKESQPLITPEDMVHQMKIYFAAQPGLYYILPASITRKIKDKFSIISFLGDMQQKK
jgi:hypothetical protein